MTAPIVGKRCDRPVRRLSAPRFMRTNSARTWLLSTMRLLFRSMRRHETMWQRFLVAAKTYGSAFYDKLPPCIAERNVDPSRSSTAKPESASVARNSACQLHKGGCCATCHIRRIVDPAFGAQTWRRIHSPQVSKKWLLAFTRAKTADSGSPAGCFRCQEACARTSRHGDGRRTAG